MNAILSPCGTYRYTLTRDIPHLLRWGKPCLFVMLNPSTADASKDDPTIRRCKAFAQQWDCASLTVVNLFALRATDPSSLARHSDPVGPDNDKHLTEQIMDHWHYAGIIIAAWGTQPIVSERRPGAIKLLRAFGAQCLGKTKDGSPRHPLYVKADTQLVPL